MKSSRYYLFNLRNILLKLNVLDKDVHSARYEAYKSGKEYIKELEHPERLAVIPYCKIGKGIDVGCGHRKTSDNCIGVDLVKKGDLGQVGCITGKNSQADICASGDYLYMFNDGELDFVIARHNLEHYIDVVKTLREWKRVLKKGGVMAIILPDENGLNKVGKRGVELDSTHEHSFTQESFANIIDAIGGLEIIKLRTVIKNWSFICVSRKL